MEFPIRADTRSVLLAAPVAKRGRGPGENGSNPCNDGLGGGEPTCTLAPRENVDVIGEEAAACDLDGDGSVSGDEEEACADDHPPATPDAVMDHIREVCANAPGVNFPSSNDPGRFSKWFQSSVRKSINAAIGDGNKFKQDPGVPEANGSSFHPQLTNQVDGYAEVLADVDGLFYKDVPGVVTAILETKFGTRPGNRLEEDQYRTHIRDLEKAYALAPDGEINWGAPQYVYVTNSTLEDKGVGGGYAERKLTSYAEDHNVNVMHLRVTKDPRGPFSDAQFYLEGGLIGNPVDWVNWIKKLTGDTQDQIVPFQVECEPEN